MDWSSHWEGDEWDTHSNDFAAILKPAGRCLHGAQRWQVFLDKVSSLLEALPQVTSQPGSCLCPLGYPSFSSTFLVTLKNMPFEQLS